jgi:hypothetical protein
MKNVFVLLTFTLISCTAYSGDKDRFFEMSESEIDSLLTVTAQKQMTITDRMNFFSAYFLETPYSFTCVGDGPYALYETYPLVNFEKTNCMSYCEHVLALSISDSWDNFFNNLQHIRYKDGLIGMRTRNHYTMGDWLPENQWLLTDVSRHVGGKFTKTVTRTISHQKFFAGKKIKDMRHVQPDREMTIDYIPSKALLEIKENLKVGDIGALIFANKTDIFSAHMFMVMRQNDKLIIRESSTSTMSTFDTEYEKWADSVQNRDRYIGITLMRVNEQLNRAGRLIYPMEINQLKKKSQ